MTTLASMVRAVERLRMRLPVLAAILFLSAVPARAQVSFVGQVASGSFGSQGSETANKVPSLPSYVSSINVSGASVYTWSTGVTTWYTSASENFAVAFSDSNPHNVTLYLIDDDSTARVETVTVLQNGVALDSRMVSNFHAGVYLTWTVTGNTTFNVAFNAGANAVATSILFDAAPGQTPPPPTCGSNVTLFWQASAGATGYNVYQNGTKITSSPISNLSYFIGGLAAGTYSFQITAVNAQGESALPPSLTVTVGS